MRNCKTFKQFLSEEAIHKGDVILPDNVRALSRSWIPARIKGGFGCTGNKLTSLIGGPEEITNSYYCSENQLTSLEGVANKIGKDLVALSNKLTSLQGIHKYFKGGYIGGQIWIAGNPISSHILGLLLIDKLKKVDLVSLKGDLKNAVIIINKHLAGDRDVIECQQELIEAGLKQYAQL